MYSAGLLDDNNSEVIETEKKKKNVGTALKGAGKKMFGLLKKLGKKKKKEVEVEEDEKEEIDDQEQDE